MKFTLVHFDLLDSLVSTYGDYLWCKVLALAGTQGKFIWSKIVSLPQILTRCPTSKTGEGGSFQIRNCTLDLSTWTPLPLHPLGIGTSHREIWLWIWGPQNIPLPPRIGTSHGLWLWFGGSHNPPPPPNPTLYGHRVTKIVSSLCVSVSSCRLAKDRHSHWDKIMFLYY